MLQDVLDKIDELNAMDPHRVVHDGQETSKEILYSERMTERVHRFREDPTDVLQIAARAQHIQRWKISRQEYPMTKAGYKTWRKDLALHHSDLTSAIMEEEGYFEKKINAVRELLTKRNLKMNSDVQVLEDVVCLVFLEHYFENFAKKHSEEKLITIVKKTWAKMSDHGHQVALTLNLSEAGKDLVTRALS